MGANWDKQGNYQKYNSDGSTPVMVVGSLAKDVTLLDAVSSTGNGVTFEATDGTKTLNFEVFGTSTSRTVVFELIGPSTTAIAIKCFNVLDPTLAPASSTTGGSTALPEVWQVIVPAGFKFRTRLSAVVGGNVSIKGWEVA